MIEEDKSEIVSFADDSDMTTHSTQVHISSAGNSSNKDSNSGFGNDENSSSSASNQNPLFNENTHDDVNESNGPTSSIENIIPPQLQKGFSIFSSWVSQAAVVVSTKASEVNNSEVMKDFKQKSQRFTNDTIVAATPMWEATKENVNLAMEVTYQSTSQVVEQLKPALHEVSTKVSEGVASGWQSISEAATQLVKPASSEEPSHSSVGVEVPNLNTQPSSSSFAV